MTIAKTMQKNGRARYEPAALIARHAAEIETAIDRAQYSDALELVSWIERYAEAIRHDVTKEREAITNARFTEPL